jgi:hypothetical protein
VNLGTVIPARRRISGGLGDDGSADRRAASFFHEFRLDDRVPKDYPLSRINRFLSSVLGGLHELMWQQPIYCVIQIDLTLMAEADTKL